MVRRYYSCEAMESAIVVVGLDQLDQSLWHCTFDQRLAQVKKVTCNPAGDDPMGEVTTGASLTLHTKSVPACMRQRSGQKGYSLDLSGGISIDRVD